jgi:hypothetical protein
MYEARGNFSKVIRNWRVLLGLLVLLAAGGWLLRRPGMAVEPATFAVRRGPLQISVLEGGTMQALDSQELKCEVRVGFQGAKILKIVDEGYLVTEDDVKTNKVLIELDSSELQKQLVAQEIVFQTAAATLADAQQGYDIQLNQNLSDIMGAEQKARFARMDCAKFLGSAVADEVIRELGVDELFHAARTNRSLPLPLDLTPPPFALETNGSSIVLDRESVLESLELPSVLHATTNGTVPAALAERLQPEPVRASSINFARYADITVLGDGEAKQKIRKFHDDWQVAQKEMGQAQATLDGTKRLFARQFVTRTDLQRDEINFENTRLKVQTAETARDLFLKYDFLKTAEETLSKYCEAVREMERVRKAGIARLAQAEARLRSATAQYGVQVRQRADLEQQVQKCLIRAAKPGLVIYGRAGDDSVFIGGEERIREGATVRERQTILTIPDLAHMGVKVKIHETYIKKVKAGQRARITVDAFPDQVLDGEVTKVGVLPDSQNRWMNPDLKVYLTTVTVDGTNDWLKPGMSTKVEILVDHLDDVLYVPIQSVVLEGATYMAYVRRGGKAERVEVEIGQFNDEFIEVISGVAENDLVLLDPPKSVVPAANEEEARPGEKEEHPGSPARGGHSSSNSVVPRPAAAVILPKGK